MGLVARARARARAIGVWPGLELGMGLRASS